jgi:hypothetical protein
MDRMTCAYCLQILKVPNEIIHIIISYIPFNLADYLITTYPTKKWKYAELLLFCGASYSIVGKMSDSEEYSPFMNYKVPVYTEVPGRFFGESWDGLMRHTSDPAVTWDIVTANPDFHWDYGRLSANPNITWDIVKANPDKAWDYIYLSANPNFTYDIIDNDAKDLMKLGIDVSGKWYYHSILRNKSITNTEKIKLIYLMK